MKTYKKIDGVLLLNKPLGISSNRALQRAKGIMQAAKAGHTGSLDPLATGVLPICFGEATKFSQFLLDANKTYRVRGKLGVTTTTADCEGDVLETKPVPKIDNMQAELDKFKGHSKQIPSMFSAIKHKGQPLYKLARKNIEVERKPRDINIFEFELLEHVGDEIHCMVTCSKGTYIRNLIEDLGKNLGCGAHVTELERTRVAEFKIEDSYTLEDLETVESPLLSLECLLEDFPKICLSIEDTRDICHGKVISAPSDSSIGIVRLYNEDNEILGIGEALNDGSLIAKRLLST